MNNYYNIFYWLTRADNVSRFFDIASNIFTVATVILLISYFISSIGATTIVGENNLKNSEEEKSNPQFRAWDAARIYLKRMFYTSISLMIVAWLGYVFTPTKKDCLLIVAGGAVGNFLTSDSSARELPSDVTKFLHLSLTKEIQDLSAETQSDIKRELGIQSPKEKLIDNIKQMSKEEIIKLIQNDTSIIK